MIRKCQSDKDKTRRLKGVFGVMRTCPQRDNIFRIRELIINLYVPRIYCTSGNFPYHSSLYLTTPLSGQLPSALCFRIAINSSASLYKHLQYGFYQLSTLWLNSWVVAAPQCGHSDLTVPALPGMMGITIGNWEPWFTEATLFAMLMFNFNALFQNRLSHRPQGSGLYKYRSDLSADR